ncbi:hypothetical protein B0I35DRAFT_418984 [Stachybotrys elegans]|uniref:NmrA-like domain-containing protein n=1 Tax=Stachybotrys elegans TaxID=80388 RepID=A0A8K0T542_9HYPO|nr:hypothetical protein B0I35DRAFT_418984 [Stachybotrys elegans]
MSSSPKKILVTAATGNQGGGVVRHCLQHGHHVYALVRDPSKPAAKQLQDLGAVLVQGDLENRESVQQAMQGMDAVFLMEVKTRDSEGDLRRTLDIIEAAKASSTVTTMIASTAIKTGEHQALEAWGPDHPMYAYWLNKAAIEQHVRDAGFQHWTIIRPGHFLQMLNSPLNRFTFPGFAEDFVLRVAWKPQTKIPWIDASDVGIVAAEALSHPDKLMGREIELVAEALTIEETAARLSDARGKPVRVHYYTEQELAEVKSQSIVTRGHEWENEVFGDKYVAPSTAFNLTSVKEYLASPRFSPV